MGAIELLLNDIDNTLVGFVNTVFFQLSPAVHSLWRILMILFVVIYGYRVMTSGNYEAREMFMKMLKLVIVLVIATEWAAFSIVVYNLATQFPGEIGAQILASRGESNTGVNTGLTQFFDAGFQVAGKFYDESGWNNKMYLVYAVLTSGFTILFGGYATFLIVLAKLAVALLLAVAPVFIILLVFGEMRELFMGWLRTLLNYSLIPLFVYTLLALVGAIIAERLIDLDTAISTNRRGVTEAMAAFSLCAFTGFLLSLQIMSIVSGITGGYSLSTLGAVSRNAMRSMRFGNWAARKSPAVARSARTGAFVAGGAAKEGASALGRTLQRIRTGGNA